MGRGGFVRAARDVALPKKLARKRGGLIARLLPLFVFKPQLTIDSGLFSLLDVKESHALNAVQCSFLSQVIRFLLAAARRNKKAGSVSALPAFLSFDEVPFVLLKRRFDSVFFFGEFYWQDSQVPPVRMASSEQAAAFSGSTSLAGRLSRLALSRVLLFRVRR